MTPLRAELELSSLQCCQLDIPLFSGQPPWSGCAVRDMAKGILLAGRVRGDLFGVFWPTCSKKAHVWR